MIHLMSKCLNFAALISENFVEVSEFAYFFLVGIIRYIFVNLRYISFGTVRFLLKGPFAEELFDVVASYFPVEYRPVSMTAYPA